MSNDQALIKKLFEKYANGSASPEEVKQLFSLISDRQYDEEMKNLLLGELQETELQDNYDTERWSNVFNKVKAETELMEFEEKPVRYIGFRRLAIAASIAACLGIGFYFYQHQSKPAETNQLAKNDIAPGQNKATLTLANGQQIVLTKGLTGKLANQGNTTIQVNNGNNITYVSNNQTQTDVVLYNTLTTVRGEQSPYPLVLADGTKAWLNAASSITFPTAFNGKDRTVKITGEVYFEVAHNEKQQFKVESKGQTIEDIGTAFNVNAYNDEPETRTTLISGIVKVNGHTLKPGQAATGEKAVIQDADTEGAIAWKNNYFKFDHEDLGNAMRKVSRWYNVEIVYPSGKPVTENYYGTMSRFSNLSKVLSKLEFIGAAKFKLEGNKVIVTQK